MFDPTLPANNSPNSSAEMRSQLTGLRDLIDTIPVGPQGPPGPDGPQGPQGNNGMDGFNGSNGSDGPQGTAGTNGLDGTNGSNGLDGAQGPPGEVSNAQLALEIAGTSANSNGVSTLDIAFINDPATLADIELMRAKVNELIGALRRV